MLRRLALRLAFLAPEDRDWLLSQLSTADEKRITSLITEANEMGLTKDPSIFYSIAYVKTIKHDNTTEIQKDELDKLSLFWQNLIQIHQDDVQKKNLPNALMRSVISHAKESLVNNMENQSHG